MPKKRKVERTVPEIDNYSFEDRHYQIDLGSKKVYRSYVEIETSKAFEILTSWRSQRVSV